MLDFDHVADGDGDGKRPLYSATNRTHVNARIGLDVISPSARLEDTTRGTARLAAQRPARGSGFLGTGSHQLIEAIPREKGTLDAHWKL